MDDNVQQLIRERRFNRAFELLLDRYQRKVFRLAVSFLEQAAAEEVTQDIFLKLWQALPLYDGRASLSTWLYTIARNTCLTAVRSASYRRTVPLDPELHSGRETMAPAVEVADLLQRLPEAQREVIVMFYLQERSIEDVAAVLDMPEGTVKSHLHRARRELARMARSYQ